MSRAPSRSDSVRVEPRMVPRDQLTHTPLYTLAAPFCDIFFGSSSRKVRNSSRRRKKGIGHVTYLIISEQGCARPEQAWSRAALRKSPNTSTCLGGRQGRRQDSRANCNWWFRLEYSWRLNHIGAQQAMAHIRAFINFLTMFDFAKEIPFFPGARMTMVCWRIHFILSSKRPQLLRCSLKVT